MRGSIGANDTKYLMSFPFESPHLLSPSRAHRVRLLDLAEKHLLCFVLAFIQKAIKRKVSIRMKME